MRMSLLTLTMVALVLCMGLSAPAEAAGALKPEQLQCEWRCNPLGIDTTEPRLSWIVTSKQRGQVQSAYRILVASDPKRLAKDGGDLWDSGKVLSSDTSSIVYGGKPLASETQCFWKVRIWDGDDKPSSWGKPALWTMGLLQKSDWKARWIGLDAARERPTVQQLSFKSCQWIWFPEGNATAGVPAERRFFRKEISIPAGREVATAFCAATADNSYTLYVNGQRVDGGNSFKQAGAIDVKEYLRAGKNAIAIEAANEGDSANPAGVIANLRVQYADGGTTVVASDETWRTSKSAPDGWREIDFEANGWEHAKTAAAYGAGPWGEVTIGAKAMFLPPAQLLRTRFLADKPIERATVYASALGDYQLYINGDPVGDAYFTPGWTEYKVRVYYNTYDVTDQLKEGFNAIGAVLGDGWYSGYIGWGRIRDHYGKDPRFAAQLHIEYTDGTTRTIATDDRWKANTGPILEGDFLMGETYDARLEVPGWSQADFDDSQWSDVDAAEQVSIAIEAYPGVPVQEFQEIKPVEITEPKPGAYVFDMGTNFAGFVRLKVSDAEPGQKIVLRFAERLDDTDNTIYTTNLRGARAIDTYTCKGQGTEVWQPRFTFHGFQYVEVTGYPGAPDKDAITGIELTSATPVVGQFECSDEMANTLYHNICQTQRANFIEVPTDCPQRDERLGWMGDAQIYVRTATYNSDVAAFFNKWLVDVEDAQLPDGGFSDVAPRIVANGGGTAAWGDAGVICPWTIYQVYGDTRVLSEHYDAMEEWIAYCQKTSKGLLRPASGYGDWLSIKADTPKDVLATAYFAYSTKLVAKTAKVLGKANDVRKYEELFDEIKRAFNRAYVAPDGRIKGNTQTVYVLALAFDLLPEDKQALATEYLVEDIRSRNWHLSTGFVGTKDLMATLTRFGQTNVAYHLFHNKSFPSWGFSIQHGATSIWERWDGWTPEKGFQDAGMNSFAHYSFGAVAEWMFKTIGGIDTDGPAYDRIIIRPRPGGRLSWAKTSYNSVRGPIATNWKIKKIDGAKQLSLKVTIPANTTAMVYVPTQDPARVKAGKDLAMTAKAVKFVGTDGDVAIFEIGSGDYAFTSPLPQ